MTAALAPGMLVTELVDQLVRKGELFRETHHFSRWVVALAEKKAKPSHQLDLNQLQGVDALFCDDVTDAINSRAMRSRRQYWVAGVRRVCWSKWVGFENC
jgi:argininosuccinate lyase